MGIANNLKSEFDTRARMQIGAVQDREIFLSGADEMRVQNTQHQKAEQGAPVNAGQGERKNKDMDAAATLFEIEQNRIAYEAFMDSYRKAMDFYDEADERLNKMEADILAEMNEIESTSEEINLSNGQTAYKNDNGQFVTLNEDGEERAMTDPALLAEARAAEAALRQDGKTVRSTVEQEHLILLTNQMTRVMDLRGESQIKREKAQELAEKDPSEITPAAKEAMEQDAKELEESLREFDMEMEEAFGFSENKNSNQIAQSPNAEEYVASVKHQHITFGG